MSVVVKKVADYSDHYSVKVRAGEVVEAIKTVLKRKKKQALTLRYLPSQGSLAVLDALHEAVEVLIPSDGFWDQQVQVNAEMLKKVLSLFSIDEIVELIPAPATLFIVKETFKVGVPRMDGEKGKGIKLRPMPDQGHIGPIIERPPMIGGTGIMQVRRDSALWRVMEEQRLRIGAGAFVEETAAPEPCRNSGQRREQGGGSALFATGEGGLHQPRLLLCARA